MMLAENVVELTIASQLEYIDLVTNLTDNISRMLGFDEEASYWINMAVRESVANAVEHGNKYDPQKTVDVRFTIGVDALRVSVRDHGEGFDPATLPDPLDPNNLLNPAGRGILYIKTFMDNVVYEHHPEGGMVVTMTKRRAPQPSEPLAEPPEQAEQGESKHDAVEH
jgi:serine/threonine-protein kinase RsbW